MAQAGDRKSPLMADAEEPLVLVGPPRDIRGEFLVRNPTERKIIVRQPVLKAAAAATGRTKAAAAAAKAGIAALPETVALRRIKVRAGQSRPVPLSLTLDPRTPPGTYQAELDVDGEQRSGRRARHRRRGAGALAGRNRPTRARRREVREARGLHQRGQRARARKGPRRRRARGRSGALPGAARRAAGRRRHDEEPGRLRGGARPPLSRDLRHDRAARPERRRSRSRPARHRRSI